MAITAPFRFARINRWVYKPSWGHLVTHDIPFKDGLSGEIEFTIKAETPLIVGGPRAKSVNGTHNTVGPFQLPSGDFSIPSSSIQGMVRAVLDIITFGKLGPRIQRRRFAIRDISGNPTGKAVYQGRMSEGNGNTIQTAITPKVKTGWLIKGPIGPVIVPCKMARISYQDIINLVAVHPAAADGMTTRLTNEDRDFLNRHNGDHQDAKDAPGRYKRLLGIGNDLKTLAIQGNIEEPPPSRHSPGYIKYTKWVPPAQGRVLVDGTLVLTGKASPGNGEGRKHFEFVFHTPSRDNAKIALGFPITEDVFRDFLLIHEPDSGKSAQPNPNWTFWKERYRKGEPVPIFYLDERPEVIPLTPNVTAMGTAYMFKLAMPLSTHDMLKTSAVAHVSQKADALEDPTWGDFDLSSLIFGATGGANDSYFERNLKRRASFDFAKPPQIAPTPIRYVAGDQNNVVNPTPLLSPKPSYYPIYTRQTPRNGQLNAQSQHPNGAIYDTYNKALTGMEPPELAGRKIWPVIASNRIINQPQPVPNNDSVKTLLRPLGVVDARLDDKDKFTCTLRVHNLRKFELGALLWALTLGDPTGDSNRRHRLGGGKPLGLGVVSIRLKKLKLVANMKDATIPNATSLVQYFETTMDKFLKSDSAQSEINWRETPQVRAVLAASIDGPDENQFKYMELGGYSNNKNERHFLPEYPSGTKNEFHRNMPSKPSNNGIDELASSAKPDDALPAKLVPTTAQNQFSILGKPLLVENASDAFVPTIVRANPPPERANFPAPSKFRLLEKVKVRNDDKEFWIVGYPNRRAPINLQYQLEWIVCHITESGKQMDRRVIENNLTAIEP